ncbi:MAG: DNA alkylation repair protein [Nanoarchaeota archaeon]|mgnify:FL=1
MNINQAFQSAADHKKAKLSLRFFKTGKGEYGEGDVFLGIAVQKIRKIAKEFKNISLGEVQKLLDSEIHEKRLCALVILIKKYKTADEIEKKDIFDFYMKNTRRINNWDLVDLSAPNIMGHYLHDKDKKILHELSVSADLWKKRIAVLATFYFIRKDDFKDAIKIAETLLNDAHDLIHKAVGWMLREIGKRNQEIEEDFLKKHRKSMPRTMLRYAIEKFPEEKRKFYLKN